MVVLRGRREKIARWIVLLAVLAERQLKFSEVGE